MHVARFTALAVLLSLCGCAAASQPATDPQPAPVARPTTVGAPPADFTLPFDRYQISRADLAVVTAAQNAQTTACTTAQGVSWKASTPAFDLSGNARRYGVIDPQTAKQHGYHVPPDAPGSGELTDSQLDKVIACKTAADARLNHGVGSVDRGWLDSLDFSSFDASAKLPDVLRATAGWSRCMKAAGSDYPDPPAAIADPRWNLDSPTPSPEEIVVASNDVRCKGESRLVEVQARAETAIQQRAIAADPARFAALARANALILANARALLASR
jgi:hypothetical protein